MTKKLTAKMRRILGNIHNHGGPADRGTLPGGGDEAVAVELIEDGYAERAEEGRLRITAAGRAALGLAAPPPDTELSAIVEDKTGRFPIPEKLETREEARMREARSKPPAYIEKAASMTEAAIVLDMAAKIERAVALRNSLTAEDWLELFTLAHKGRAMVKELQELRDKPLRDDDPAHPQEG